MVSPEVYIPIAEESSLILDIGLWVLEQACRDLKLLEQIGLPNSFKKLSINVSPKQLQQSNFKDLVLFNVKKHNIQPEHLGLELTENLLVESFEKSIVLIEELKEQGIDCSIDDFGTGYSSLSYLRRIPASLLKIDRSFVIDIDQQTEGAAIAKMIISLGNTLNMDVYPLPIKMLCSVASSDSKTRRNMMTMASPYRMLQRRIAFRANDPQGRF